MIWRAPRGTRIAGWVIIGVVTALLVAAVIEAEGDVSALTSTMLLWVLLVGVVVLELRSYVALTDWQLIIRNPIREYEVSLFEIEAINTGLGLWIITKGGLVLKASALSATRVSKTQRDRVKICAEAIRKGMADASGSFSG